MAWTSVLRHPMRELRSRTGRARLAQRQEQAQAYWRRAAREQAAPGYRGQENTDVTPGAPHPGYRPSAEVPPVAGQDQRSQPGRAQAGQDRLHDLVSRAHARAEQERADAARARDLPAALRLEYDEAVWAARHPRPAGLPGAARRDAYYSYRYHRWLETNAERMTEVPDPQRHERFRGDEAWRRYRDHLPPRDDAERGAFREWAELDADDAEDAFWHRLLPEQLYEAYSGPLSWDGFYARYLQDLHGPGSETDPPAAGGPRTADHQDAAGNSPVPPRPHSTQAAAGTARADPEHRHGTGSGEIPGEPAGGRRESPAGPPPGDPRHPPGPGTDGPAPAM